MVSKVLNIRYSESMYYQIIHQQGDLIPVSPVHNRLV